MECHRQLFPVLLGLFHYRIALMFSLNDAILLSSFLHILSTTPRTHYYLPLCSNVLHFEIPSSPSSSLSYSRNSFIHFKQWLSWSAPCFVFQFLLHHRTATVTSLLGECLCLSRDIAFIREMIPEQAELPSCLLFPADDASWASDNFHCFGCSQIERYHFWNAIPKASKSSAGILCPTLTRAEELFHILLDYVMGLLFSVYDTFLLGNRRTLLSHVQLVIQYYP